MKKRNLTLKLFDSFEDEANAEYAYQEMLFYGS
jgi:hypothetical protein